MSVNQRIIKETQKLKKDPVPGVNKKINNIFIGLR